MKVLITGASSGIGKEMAKIFSRKGYDLVLVARDLSKLEELKTQLETERPNSTVQTVSVDLSVEDNCKKLCEQIGDVDILVNNAGFGDCGLFTETDLDKELKMIRTNVTAYHILMKEYLKRMKKNNRGQILNVASVAGFLPGPLMATYYATKAYVVRLTEAVRVELKKEKSAVRISMLCPGPVATNFSKRAEVNFQCSEADSSAVAAYAIKKMEKGKFYIVPRFSVKMMRLGAKLFPTGLVSKVAYRIQKQRTEK